MQTHKTKDLSALARADWIKTVAHVPTEFNLLQDSQDIHACLEHVGMLDRLSDAGCLFALAADGEMLAVYLCERSVPVLTYRVERIYPQ